MKKTALILATLFSLTACGGGKLPSSCVDALKGFAALDDAQKKQLSMVTTMRLKAVLRQGNGDVDKAIDVWKTTVEAQYEAVSKQKGSKTADLLISQSEQQCEEWKKEIKK
ncbi:hypothetical protein [Paralysiella testudinis]|uniref:Lipoprotein n=1 Tax=Paralysiella testudinis TaxID=2809020 RepID=A0A892ZFX5_9NEIS|nr:hypothetical protein [Paralysiella testudinis]QRQ81543.1 hypothetical protein JQU52_12705 [Paralysiella testudinis]